MEIEDPEVIKYIPRKAASYAHRVIKGRWIEAEPYILKDLHVAIIYAEMEIKGRWSELESLIINNIHYAKDYAIRVMKERWIEAEPLIFSHPWIGALYGKHFNIPPYDEIEIHDRPY